MATQDLGFNIFALDRASKTFVRMAQQVERLEDKLDQLDRKRANPQVNIDVDESRIRGAVGDIADVAEDEAGRRRGSFFRALFTPDGSIVRALRTGIPAVLGSPIGAAALSLGGLFAASFVGAVISAGVFAAIGAGFVGIAAVVLRENERLTDSWARLAETATSQMQSAASSLVPVFSDALRLVEAMFAEHIAGPLRAIFTGIAPIVLPIVRQLVEAVGTVLDAIAAPEALDGLRQVFAAFEASIPRIADAVAGFLTTIMSEGPLAAEGVSLVTSAVENLLNFAGDAVTTLTQMAVGLADMWDQASVVLGPVVAAVGGLVGLVTDLHPAVILLGTAFGVAATAVARFGFTLRAAQFAMGPFGLIIGTISAAFAAFASGSDEAERSQRELLPVMRQVASAADDQKRQLAASEIQKMDIMDTARDLGIELSTLTDIFLGDADAADQLRSRLQDVVREQTTTRTSTNFTSESIGEQGRAAQDLITWLDETAQTSDQVATEQQELAEATGRTAVSKKRLQEQIASTTEALEAERDKLAQLKDTMFDTGEQTLSLRDAHREFEEAVDNASETVDDNGQTLDINTEKGRQNQEAIDGIAKAAHRQIQALVESGASTEDVTEATKDAREAFIDAAEAAGRERDEAEELADQLGLVPSEVETRMEAIDNMSGKIEELERRLERLERARETRVRADTGQAIRGMRDIISLANQVPRHISTTHTIRTIGSYRPPPRTFGRADGGPVFPGQDFLVGEEGPELVRFGAAGFVTPARQTQQFLRGGGPESPAQEITLRVDVTGADRHMVAMVRQMLREGKVSIRDLAGAN